MPRKRRQPARTPEELEQARQMMLHAIGVAGWAVAAELVMVLVEQKVMSDKRGRKVLIGATACIRLMDEVAPNEAFKAAYDVLAGQLEGWAKVRK